MALGRVAARQRNQVGFAPIVQLAIPVGLGMVVQHALQPRFGVPPFGAEHRALRRVQSRRHLGALHPSSVLSRMRARLMTRAECRPLWINPRNCS